MECDQFYFLDDDVSSTAPDERFGEDSDYLDQSCTHHSSDPLEYWQSHQGNFPTWTKLIGRCLSFPASSEQVERLFGIAASKVVRPDGTPHKTIQDSVFIRCNSRTQTKTDECCRPVFLLLLSNGEITLFKMCLAQCVSVR